jgi:hypothetical protein
VGYRRWPMPINPWSSGIFAPPRKTFDARPLPFQGYIFPDLWDVTIPQASYQFSISTKASPKIGQEGVQKYSKRLQSKPFFKKGDYNLPGHDVEVRKAPRANRRRRHHIPHLPRSKQEYRTFCKAQMLVLLLGFIVLQ